MLFVFCFIWLGIWCVHHHHIVSIAKWVYRKHEKITQNRFDKQLEKVKDRWEIASRSWSHNGIGRLAVCLQTENGKFLVTHCVVLSSMLKCHRFEGFIRSLFFVFSTGSSTLIVFFTSTGKYTIRKWLMKDILVHSNLRCARLSLISYRIAVKHTHTIIFLPHV